VTQHMDRLFAEVDRQLEHVRSQTDAVAIRSGFLIATTAVAASLLAARLQANANINVTGPLVALGIAALAGLAALAPLLKTGPDVLTLQDWANKTTQVDRAAAISGLYKAKLELLDGNRKRLWVMIGALILQGIAVIVAVVLTLIATAGS
jgi:hypothetical protein